VTSHGATTATDRLDTAAPVALPSVDAKRNDAGTRQTTKQGDMTSAPPIAPGEVTEQPGAVVVPSTEVVEAHASSATVEDEHGVTHRERRRRRKKPHDAGVPPEMATDLRADDVRDASSPPVTPHMPDTPDTPKGDDA
jgi:hypothetical protein